MESYSIDPSSRHRSVNSTVDSSLGQSRSIKKPIDPYDVPPISKEDQMRAMLGYKTTTTGTMQPYLFREDFCASCGMQHPNPRFLDIYFMCYSCCNTLREPASLRKRYKGTIQESKLDILCATYGDPYDASKAIDVTHQCIEKVNFFWNRDRISFKSTDDLVKIFGSDPAPGKNKQLRIRYRIMGVHATASLDCLPTNFFTGWVLLIAGDERNLKITRASYGHPRGIQNGRMSFDVTELVQGLVDLAGGSYLVISSMTPLQRLFGDPCPGYTKDLRIKYEVAGTTGHGVYDVVRGRLRQRVHVQASPTIAPLIFVVSATYGITPTSRRNILEKIAKDLRKIDIIEHRVREGLAMTPEEVFLWNKKKALLTERETYQNAEIKFIDITNKIQKFCDTGGMSLRVDKDIFDPNYNFGNPSPGFKKLLEIQLSCQGHDSEKQTDSHDITSSGFKRNYITAKSVRLMVSVTDDPSGAGVMSESLEFHTDMTSPFIEISRATYGVLADPYKIMDVTNEIQRFVKGRILRIDGDVNLEDIFRNDPAIGLRKQLAIEWSTPGLMGNIRVRERDQLLIASVELGYPPEPPRDEFEDITTGPSKVGKK